VNTPEAKHIMSPTPYATSGDFHRIFKEEKDSLYRLSFLLTADYKKAQQCFVSGLEDSVKGNPVFKEWTRSWARRMIIKNAVRIINPRPIEESGLPSFQGSDENLAVEWDELAAVLDLGPFERFVLVMSVLERYSEPECSILLGCSRRDVTAALGRALQQIGSAMGSNFKQQANVGSQGPGLHEKCRSVLEDLLQF
jgi:DNA-directed RNA polymerase specialized sigma24 family protein